MHDKWLSMDTAPKDGTVIIVYRPVYDGTYIPKVGMDYWHKRLDCWAKSRENTPPVKWQHFPEPPEE